MPTGRCARGATGARARRGAAGRPTTRAQPRRQPRRRVRLLGGRRQRDGLGRRDLAVPAVGLPRRDARRLRPRLAHRLRRPRALLRDERGRDGHVGPRRGPDRAADAEPPLPPVSMGAMGDRWIDGFERLGWYWWVQPQAIASRDYRGRPACTNNGHCTFGCPTGALATPANTYWPEALRYGVRLQTGARVREITLDTRGRADGVLYHAADGSVQRATAARRRGRRQRAGHAAAAAHVVVARVPRRAGELQRHRRPQPHGPRADDRVRALPGAHGRRPRAVGRDRDDAALLRDRPVARLQARVHHHGDARVRRRSTPRCRPRAGARGTTRPSSTTSTTRRSAGSAATTSPSRTTASSSTTSATTGSGCLAS